MKWHKSDFEDYTLIIYRTPKDYYLKVPEDKFIAHLEEIPEASLREYGATPALAIRKLRKLFEIMVVTWGWKKVKEK